MTATGLCFLERQGYKSRAVEFSERCSQQRSHPIVKRSQLICPNNNLISKLQQVFLRHELAEPVKIAPAQAHLAYCFWPVRFHGPRIMNVSIPFAGSSIDAPKKLYENGIGSLAFLTSLQDHLRGRKDQISAISCAAVRIERCARQRHRKIAQSVEQTEHPKLKRGPCHAHMPEFRCDLWRETEVAQNAQIVARDPVA